MTTRMTLGFEPDAGQVAELAASGPPTVPDGTVYAAWSDTRSGDSDIYFARRDPATGAWTPSERVNNVTTGAQTQPAIVIDATRNVYVVWTDARLGAADDDIYFAKRSSSTGAWSASVRVNDDGAGKHQNDPSIAISGTGEAIAAWYDERGGGSKKYIYSARLAPGGTTWSANLKVTSDQSAAKAEPEVAIGTDGVTYAAWRDQRSGNADIWFATLPLGSTSWSTNTKISDDPGTASQDAPDIGLDTAGNLIAVWNDARTTPSQIRAARRPAGSSTWSASVAVGGSLSNAPSIGVRPDGHAYVAWSNGTLGTLTTVWGSEYDPGAGTWAAPERLTDPAEEGAAAAVGYTAVQLVVLDQRRPSGGTYDIYSRRKALGGDESAYGYDRLSRLVTVTGPDGARTYAYDPLGNRLAKTAGATTSYSYDRADRITAAGALVTTVDADGNLVARGPDTFAFDGANRLTGATVAGASETYAYDGDGVRFTRQVGANQPIRSVTDLTATLPVTLDDGTRKYVYGHGLAYAVTGATTETYHADRLGSIRALTDGSGAVTASYRSDEWGLAMASSGTSSQPFGWIGEPRDGTGLSYLRARSYDPSLGRFLSRDPYPGTVTRPISLSRCPYANDNPTTLSDPSGLAAPGGSWGPGAGSKAPAKSRVLWDAVGSVVKCEWALYVTGEWVAIALGSGTAFAGAVMQPELSPLLIGGGVIMYGIASYNQDYTAQAIGWCLGSGPPTASSTVFLPPGFDQFITEFFGP